MELWTAFILGLAGSTHCAGMCGPLALALPSAPGAPARFLLGRLSYNLGRMMTYGTLGLLFGLVGRSLWLAGVQRWLSIALGLALLLGLVASRNPARMRPTTRLVGWLKARMSGLLQRRSILSLLVLGLLNGLLPCGLVYVACAEAAATGDVLSGGRYMACFAAGTLPLMLAIGVSGKLVPFSLRLKLAKAVPICVLILATMLILRGLALGIPYLSPDLSAGGSCCHE